MKNIEQVFINFAESSEPIIGFKNCMSIFSQRNPEDLEYWYGYV